MRIPPAPLPVPPSPGVDVAERTRQMKADTAWISRGILPPSRRACRPVVDVRRQVESFTRWQEIGINFTIGTSAVIVAALASAGLRQFIHWLLGN